MRKYPEQDLANYLLMDITDVPAKFVPAYPPSKSFRAWARKKGYKLHAALLTEATRKEAKEWLDKWELF